MTTYVADVGTEDFTVQVGGSGSVALNGEPRDAHLESIDGETLYSLFLNNRTYEVYVQASGGVYHVTVEGQRYTVGVADERRAESSDLQARLQRAQSKPTAESLTGLPSQSGEAGAVTSPMTGVLIELLVGEGETVKAGDSVAILEAMKTENIIRAAESGTVKSIEATLGQTLRMDDIIMQIDVSQS